MWNSRPFQDTKPSQEMQISTEFMYDHDFVADISVLVDTPIKNTYVKVGASKVLSPNKNIDASYVHAGIGAGAIYGFDYCWWPNGACAYSFTIGTSYGAHWCLD